MPENTDNNLELTPFRRRIRLLRVWYCGAIGGTFGAGVALVMAGFDYFSVRYFSSWQLLIPLGIGILAGMIKALWERIPNTLIARSVDRRAGLEDRLTTASEVSSKQSPLANALHQDATQHLHSLRARDLYRLRVTRWHGTLASFTALTGIVFLLGNTSFLRSSDARKEAQELKEIAKEVEQVSKPVLEEAKKETSAEADKELARRLENFASELRKARLNKQEALVKANQLAEQAKKVEQGRIDTMANSVKEAQTAAAQLEKRDQLAHMEKAESLKLAEEAKALEHQIAEMEQKLQAQKKGKGELSEQQKAEIAKRLEAAKKRLQSIHLSQQAQEFLRKLQSMPEYKEAQALLAKLAQSAAAQQAGQASELTPEQLEAAAQRLEALAKEFNTDAKLKELAKKLLEAAKNAKQCKGGNCAGGLLGAFGLGQGSGGLSQGGSKGAGAPSPDRWVGAHGSLNKDDKSSLLNAKLEDRVIQSQIGDKGSESYTEVLGPSQLGQRSAIPYQQVLPKYEKSAQAALKKGDIPPRLRTKVRDYFDSLHK